MRPLDGVNDPLDFASLYCKFLHFIFRPCLQVCLSLNHNMSSGDICWNYKSIIFKCHNHPLSIVEVDPKPASIFQAHFRDTCFQFDKQSICIICQHVEFLKPHGLVIVDLLSEVILSIFYYHGFITRIIIRCTTYNKEEQYICKCKAQFSSVEVGSHNSTVQHQR